MKDVIELYTLIVSAALPYAIGFALGNLIVGTFMRMAFGGKIEFK